MDGLLDGTTSMANPLQSVTIGSRFGRRKERKVERERERDAAWVWAHMHEVGRLGCQQQVSKKEMWARW